jgi:hypothetical protein
MFQNQYFPEPWNQMPQSTTSLVPVIHIGAPSPTSAIHVRDGSTFLQIMSTAHTQPLPIMLGAPSYSPGIIVVSHRQPIFIMKENILFPLPVMMRAYHQSL